MSDDRMTNGDYADLLTELIAWFHQRDVNSTNGAFVCALLLNTACSGAEGAHQLIDLAAKAAEASNLRIEAPPSDPE